MDVAVVTDAELARAVWDAAVELRERHGDAAGCNAADLEGAMAEFEALVQ